MTTEEMLKRHILTKYRSIREFTTKAAIPYATFATIMKRGVGSSSLSTITKICKELEISVDELAQGRVTPLEELKKEKEEKTVQIGIDANTLYSIEMMRQDAERIAHYSRLVQNTLNPQKKDDSIRLHGVKYIRGSFKPKQKEEHELK